MSHTVSEIIAALQKIIEELVKIIKQLLHLGPTPVPVPTPNTTPVPVGNTPVSNTPVANTPVANTPVANTPVANTPVANTPVANTPVANNTANGSPIMMATFQAQEFKPTIAVVNLANTPLGVDLNSMVVALQSALDNQFLPVWGLTANLVVYSSTSAVPADAWQCLLLDNADQAGALGYHDLTTGPNSLPYAKIFVVDTLQNGLAISSTMHHELMEMLLDPAVQMWAQDLDTGTLYAYEASDAVEDFEYVVNGFQMSDFVYPQFFESFRTAGSTQFDYMGKVTAPFQTTAGGYQITMTAGQVNNVFGSVAKELAFNKEDRRMHRSEYRKELAVKARQFKR